MSHPYRVLVTGSRHWSDRDAIERGLRSVGDEPSAVLVHGAAPGADTIAAEVATAMGWDVEAHPADWDAHGKAAGPRRNQEMVDAGADTCLAFPLPESRGTWDCLRRAERAGIRVIVCRAEVPA